MRVILVLTLMVISNFVIAQKAIENKSDERRGIIFGVGIGAGTLNLKMNDSSETSFSTTLPNIKIGYKLNNRLAVIALLPGANYKYNKKDRGFEGMLLAGQYWITKNWWTQGGIGLTLDAPAFYTVKEPKTAGFYTGLPAFSFAIGYEIYHKNKFTLDIQYRFFSGQSNINNAIKRKGISNMLIVGFNWF